tara:strand:+ start:1048 stop:1248 length:201 start_codon:yes stop_codon:yes gene_type:complete
MKFTGYYNIDGIALIQVWLSDNERSMSWLARKCNVSPATVKNWLERKHYPSKKHRDMLVDITGIDV